MKQANDEVLVSIQIETRLGLQRVQELASRPGVDVLFVGPQDLSVALDVPNQWEAPVMDDAIRRVVDAAERSGVVVGIQGRNAELASRWMAEGVRFVVMGTTLMLLTEAASKGINELRKRSDAIDAETSVYRKELTPGPWPPPTWSRRCREAPHGWRAGSPSRGESATRIWRRCISRFLRRWP